MIEKCPVCLGNGIVDNGFYSATRQEDGCLMWTSGDVAPEECRACSGKGYIVVSVPESVCVYP